MIMSTRCGHTGWHVKVSLFFKCFDICSVMMPVVCQSFTMAAKMVWCQCVSLLQILVEGVNEFHKNCYNSLVSTCICNNMSCRYLLQMIIAAALWYKILVSTCISCWWLLQVIT